MSLKWLKLRQSRLSWHIVFVAFASILLIEAMILIPSIIRREKELLNQLEEVSAGKVSVLTQITIPGVVEETDEQILEQVSNLPQLKPIPLMGKLRHIIVGGALYTSEGKLIGSFGEKPQLSVWELQRNPRKTFRSQDGLRYDAGWNPQKMGRSNFLIIRHDVSSVQPELNAFTIRIIGLVLIISVFVTFGVWIGLEPIVIRPILCLRNDLIKAGEAISKDEQTPDFSLAFIQRKDELGDVIAAFKKMFNQISEAIYKRKQAELALQVSLNKVEAYSEALNHELETGREIQKNFLPTQLVEKEGWEIATFFEPARQVAGDFYDTFELANGSIGLVIADVCDKGVGAALFMALFRSMLRVFAYQSKLRGPANAILEANQPIPNGWLGKSRSTNLAHLNALQAVSLTNDYVAKNHSELGMFATLFFGILEPTTGLLTYINGGHESLYILYKQGGIKERLQATGPAVGMLPEMQWSIAQTYLQPGELLFGYTDGVTEARSIEGEFFSEERLASLLNRPVASAKILLQQIKESLTVYMQNTEQFDDITMIALRHINPDQKDF
ncbi:PP2C family protein-serine/threonine phosphatase [Calothrix rhizosoleniae]|uniref:PP2C family protein-serine/threonine phosphatase n=1 Tax=Calothrix rhizosoleniae TaxID=888997 RepID=UPI000B497095|nr:PP2C family protein-serine/threonine phosphatase [Calothrix rhizosoleniae]